MTNTRNEPDQNGGRKDMTIKKGLYVRTENNVALGSPALGGLNHSGFGLAIQNENSLPGWAEEEIGAK
jgi:hypothetical protein